MGYIYSVKYPKFSDFTWTVIITLPLITYIHLRGSLLALTYDECWTFLGYAQGDIWSTITNTNPAANNHVLHSLLVTLSQWVFGESEYAIRLPALVSFIPFIYFLIQILRQLSPSRWLFGLTFLLAQPYLLDYFVLARGYSLALTFMLASVWSSFRLFESKDSRKIALLLLYAVMSAYSNFTFLLFFLAQIGLVAGYLFQQKLRVERGSWLRIVLVFAGAGILIIPPLKRVVEAEELYYGGSTGFFQDTILSIAHSLQYQSGNPILLAAIIVVAFVIIGIIAIWKRNDQFLGYLWAIALLISMGTVAQNLLLGTPYLIDRTALILVPFALFFVFLVADRIKFFHRSWMHLVLVLGAVINLGAHLNFTHTIDFREYADVDSAMQLVKSQEPNGEYALGKSIYLNAPINYYAHTLGMSGMKQADLSFCEDGPFLMLFEQDISCIENRPYELIEVYPVSGLHLYSHK